MERFTPEHFELSEDEQRIVGLIEGLPCYDHEKADLLLVWRGLKSATDITYSKRWSYGEVPQILSDEEVERFRKSLEQIGLSVTEPQRNKQDAEAVTEGEHAPYEIPGYDQAVVYVAKDAETADKLLRAAEDDLTYGTLSGFPKTAIDAYVAADIEEKFDPKELLMATAAIPADIQNEDFFAFANFRLSKEHWREELETVKKWADEIRKIDPALYAREIASRKENYVEPSHEK